MSERNDGGPAFPGAVDARSKDFTPPAQGMSLRDWFAGQALAGILAAREHINPEADAEFVYGVADAMLAERSKT